MLKKTKNGNMKKITLMNRNVPVWKILLIIGRKLFTQANKQRSLFAADDEQHNSSKNCERSDGFKELMTSLTLLVTESIIAHFLRSSG